MRQISRRSFLQFCTASAVRLGLDPFDLTGLNTALANPSSPAVLWLQGCGCTGCTISFLDYISATPPTNAADVLMNYINLAYHPNLSSVAGESAVSVINQYYQTGNYILIVEGGIPTQFNGGACYAWSSQGKDVTFQDAVRQLAARASTLLCIGTCSSFGGIPASGPNPAGVVSVQTLTGRSTINVSGCPPHPTWMVWTIVQLLQGKQIALDSAGRPRSIYASSVHSQCPNRGTALATSFAQPNHCLKALGCRGPKTGANCPVQKWNNGVSWCIAAQAPCLGCTSPDFPGTSRFYQQPA